MEQPTNDLALGILSCEWQNRPKGAPTFGDLASALRGLRREDGWLVAEYEPAAAARLAELVAAERLCCPGIDWELDGPRLTVRATPAQLEVLGQVLAAES